jgi:hypothetical protein
MVGQILVVDIHWEIGVAVVVCGDTQSVIFGDSGIRRMNVPPETSAQLAFQFWEFEMLSVALEADRLC